MRSRTIAGKITVLMATVALPGSRAVAQEVLSLAEPTASHSEPFSLISGIRELSDGRVLVSDALEESLYVLDSDLETSAKLARNGQGPDEYRQPDALFAWPADSTLMTDLGNGRLTVVGPDYKFTRTIPVVQQEGMGLQIILPSSVDGTGRIYYRPRGDGGIRDSADVVRWDPAGGEPAVVARVKLQDVIERTSGGANNMRQEVRPVPLSPEDGWSVGPDGSIAVVRSADYHVEWTRADGTVVSGPPVSWRPVPVRDADKKAWVEAMAARGVMMMVTNDNGNLNASMRRGAGGRGAPSLDGFQWPETKPPFDASTVRASPDGRLWVTRHVAAGDRPLIDIFDSGGRHVAMITLPADRELVGFGTRSMYLARSDDLGFQWLERYERPMP